MPLLFLSHSLVTLPPDVCGLLHASSFPSSLSLSHHPSTSDSCGLLHGSVCFAPYGVLNVAHGAIDRPTNGMSSFASRSSFGRLGRRMPREMMYPKCNISEILHFGYVISLGIVLNVELAVTLADHPFTQIQSVFARTWVVSLTCS